VLAAALRPGRGPDGHAGSDGGHDAAPELTPRFPCLLGGPRRLPVDAELFEEGDVAWRLHWDAASRVAPADAADDQVELTGVLEAEAPARWLPREDALLVAARVCVRWLGLSASSGAALCCAREAGESALTCSLCRATLASAHLLDIHLMEVHDSFFAAQAARHRPVRTACRPAPHAALAVPLQGCLRAWALSSCMHAGAGVRLPCAGLRPDALQRRAAHAASGRPPQVAAAGSAGMPEGQPQPRRDQRPPAREAHRSGTCR